MNPSVRDESCTCANYGERTVLDAAAGWIVLRTVGRH